ncbi:MAG: VanZ family protein [Hyphomonas sp.]|nr:VanZ family protein [Hyphomonas sp.]
MGILKDTPAIRRAGGVLALLVMGAIAVLSLLPPGDLPPVEGSDKVKHFIAYAVLAAPMTIWAGPGRTLRAVILTLGFGALMEVAQALSPTGREASLLDELANALGAALGTGLALIVRKR